MFQLVEDDFQALLVSYLIVALFDLEVSLMENKGKT